MKGTRETPMLEESADFLDCFTSPTRGWAGPHAPGGGVLPPDDSHEGPARSCGAPSGAGGAEHAAPRSRAAAHQRPPAIDQAEQAARRAVPLARMIEAEVVPRLVLAGRAAARHASAAAEPGAAGPGPEDVVALVGLVIGADAAAPLAYVEGLRLRGVTLERLYLDLFAVAAQRLGQLWTEDLCSFADVTVGLARLQGLVRQYSPAFMPSVEARDPRRTALLLPVPGEQHTFGLVMVAEFFLRAGWDVHCDPLARDEDVSAAVRQRWFAVAGISVGNNDRLDGVAALIRLVRRESRNRGIGVMVGGRVFAEKPELAGLVGADATATDGRQAALQAETLLALLKARN
jgi:MerR family transcriptional regulator, light-induced transcriptional regulator